MMNIQYAPSLTEPGVKYFLQETLKKCKLKRDKYNNRILNLSLLILFVILVCALLYYKYRTRPTEEDRKKKKQLKRDYFITRVRKLEAQKAKKNSRSITNLPKFESPFELLHKNFYKT